MVTLVPPQTRDANVALPTRGCYCIVVDVSASMNSAATVTTDDGDKVEHGWSVLDIAKHATSTFVSTLDASDRIALITYSDGADVILDWTLCNETGRAAALEAINSSASRRYLFELV